VLLARLLWQGVQFSSPRGFPYRIAASGGVLPWQRDFVYFLYYLNLYPVATEKARGLKMSTEGAEEFIATRGDTLVMDRYWTVRYGELLKAYLYLPHCYLAGTAKPLVRGRPRPPPMFYANGAAFALALMALYAAFRRIREPLLGVLLVLLLGSNPFQLYEVYRHNNVFGWNITTTLLVIALALPFLGRRPPGVPYCLIAPIATGLLLATVRQIRTEPVLVIAAAALAYLVAWPLRWRTRVSLVALLAISFVLGSNAWRGYFERKFTEAHPVVEQAGGHPYDGPRQAHHFFWHATWCGLGDFDKKYGYTWDDVTSKERALEVMQRDFDYEPSGYPPLEDEDKNIELLSLPLYWDEGRKYRRTIFEDPLYVQVVRDEVLHDVRNDPSWYAAILARRLHRALVTTTPPSLTFGRRWLALPNWPVYGALVFPAAVLAIRRRDRLRGMLLVSTLPLGATALLVYSGGGTPFYNIYHLVAFAILVEGGRHGLAPRLRSLWLRLAKAGMNGSAGASSALGDGSSGPASFAVGTPYARRPSHRTQRAVLPHWAPASGPKA